MTILIIGAAGMIGRKIASALAGEALILADAVAPAPQANASCLTLDLTAPDTPARLIASWLERKTRDMFSMNGTTLALMPSLP